MAEGLEDRYFRGQYREVVEEKEEVKVKIGGVRARLGRGTASQIRERGSSAVQCSHSFTVSLFVNRGIYSIGLQGWWSGVVWFYWSYRFSDFPW